MAGKKKTGKAQKTGDYGSATTTEAKLAEIAAAGNEAELDAMWKAWEERGWSKDGMLYAELLSRKEDLGVDLSAADLRRMEVAAKAKKEGR